MTEMWSKWKGTIFWALVAAVLLEFALSVFAERTLWHRMTGAEERLDRIETQLKSK